MYKQSHWNLAADFISIDSEEIKMEDRGGMHNLDG